VIKERNKQKEKKKEWKNNIQKWTRELFMLKFFFFLMIPLNFNVSNFFFFSFSKKKNRNKDKNKIEMNKVILNNLERTLADDLHFNLLMYVSFYFIFSFHYNIFTFFIYFILFQLNN